MRFPRTVYRLQLRPGFGFEEAAQVIPYLAALGVSHVLVSPILTAAEGSQHGYDVADPEAVNPDLGGEQGFARWCAALRAHGVGQILDIVPNHMCITTRRNRWWWDVLRLGRVSPYAGYFDIDWERAEPVLLPWLARPLSATLAAGELRLEDGLLRYGEMAFPLAPGTETAASLPELLARQHYRLAHWKLSDYELPYRRFFDVSHLIGVRVEDAAVFAATHRRILEWMARGVIDGVRVDHIDGLREPQVYLSRLRVAAPQAWIVVEKILARGEALRADWPVAGTTGYDFLNQTMG
ncbi:MAG: alpha-amylase family glycosyl hydrolase, partial [Terriglobales bacterium]